MRILGVGGSSHDFSAALIIDGQVRVAVEEERLVRIKHGARDWHTVPTLAAVDYCLDAAGVSLDDIDFIYSNIDLEVPVSFLPMARCRRVPHHLAHAALAFFSSPFPEASLLVIDGHGSTVSEEAGALILETVSFGRGVRNAIDLRTFQAGRKRLTSGTWQYITTNSLGAFYRVVTHLLGFGMRGQGKLMGLASFGSDTYLSEMSTFLSRDANGYWLFDPYRGLYDWVAQKFASVHNDFQVRADIAYATQKLFEQALLDLALRCYSESGSRFLCYSGGCALNSAANARLTLEGPFEKVHIHPASGDSGLALGAALYGYIEMKGEIQRPQDQAGLEAYTGREYSDQDIQKTLRAAPVFYRKSEILVHEIASRIADGEIVAVFRGRSEIGPRALGNRSIFSNPTSRLIRDHINMQIKNRESFRPLAPVVIQEKAGEFFELTVPSPFMLTVAPIRSRYRSTLAGVCHIDGTARVQTLERQANPFLYELLLQSERLTGFPILLNTSFNARDEPLVETPDNAMSCFLKLGINALVLGEYIVEKHTPWASRPNPLEIHPSLKNPRGSP